MRIITHKNKVPLYDNNVVLAWLENVITGRFILSDTGYPGAIHSSSDLINWNSLITEPINEETRSVYMPTHNRLYIVTNWNDDVWTDDGGFTYGTTSVAVVVPADPFYSTTLDRLIIPSVVGTSSAWSDDAGNTFQYSNKNTSQGGRGAWSDTLGLGVFLTWNNNYITTTDGITWTSPVSSGVITDDIATLYWFDELSLFVGVQGGGGNRGIVYSPDGTTWTQVPFSSFGFGTGYNYDICYNTDLSLLQLINWSGVGSQYMRIITSSDAQNWEISATFSIGNSSPSLACVYSPYGFIGVTQDGQVIQTSDMISFATYSIPGAAAIRDIKWCSPI